MKGGEWVPSSLANLNEKGDWRGRGVNIGENGREGVF